MKVNVELDWILNGAGRTGTMPSREDLADLVSDILTSHLAEFGHWSVSFVDVEVSLADDD